MYKGYGINLAHIMAGCFYTEPGPTDTTQPGIHQSWYALRHNLYIMSKVHVVLSVCMCLYGRSFRHGPNSSNSVTRQREVKQMCILKVLPELILLHIPEYEEVISISLGLGCNATPSAIYQKAIGRLLSQPAFPVLASHGQQAIQSLA